jgi:DNA-directed RNA polymerase subunit RPC12/RpoP
MDKDSAAWSRMEKYNIQDVILLEKLYYKLLPWIKSLPNRNLETDDHVCPSCGSKHLQKRGVNKTITAEYQRYQCKGCGSWSQGTTAIKKGIQLKGIGQ